MFIRVIYRASTGETCASCGGEVVVTDLGGNEIVVECDCRPSAAAA